MLPKQTDDYKFYHRVLKLIRSKRVPANKR